jgi:hypothetical protein
MCCNTASCSRSSSCKVPADARFCLDAAQNSSNCVAAPGCCHSNIITLLYQLTWLLLLQLLLGVAANHLVQKKGKVIA